MATVAPLRAGPAIRAGFAEVDLLRSACRLADKDFGMVNFSGEPWFRASAAKADNRLEFARTTILMPDPKGFV